MLDSIKSRLTLENMKISDSKKRNLYYIFFSLMLVLILKYVLNGQMGYYYGELLEIATIFLILNVTLYLVKISVVSAYRKKNRLQKNQNNNTTIAIYNIFGLILIILFVVVIFVRYKIDIIGFLTISGLFFAGLAWVFKEYVINIVNGLILMFSSNIKIGDYILVKSFKGKVINISLLNTEIKTDEGNITFVPNETILRNEIINYTKTGTKKILFNFDACLSVDLNHLKKLLDKKKDEGDIIEEINLRYGKIKSKNVNVIVDVDLKKYNFDIDVNVRHELKALIINYLNSMSSKKPAVSD